MTQPLATAHVDAELDWDNIDEDLVRRHSELSGFPANVVTEVRTMIDPQTERA